MRGVDFQVYGLSVDALVVSCYSRRFILDFAFNLGKVVEASAADVVEFCPFLLSRNARRSVWNVNLIVLWLVVALAGHVDELEDERPPCHNTTSARKEISANNVLQDRRLSGGLRPDYDLSHELVWARQE